MYPSTTPDAKTTAHHANRTARPTHDPLLRLAGGFGDATSFLRYKTFTGHVTGNLVVTMISLSRLAWFETLIRLLAIILFLASTRIGFLMGARLAPNARLFAVQAVLLCTLFGVEHGTAPSPLLGVMLFSVTLGLQNGVITALHNVSFHSTFVSGDLTKLLKPAKPQHSADSGTASNRMLVLLIAGFGGGALLASTLQRIRPSMAVPMFLLILAMAFGSATFPIK